GPDPAAGEGEPGGDLLLPCAGLVLLSLQGFGQPLPFRPGEPVGLGGVVLEVEPGDQDRKSTRLNSSHVSISYAVFCLKTKTRTPRPSFVLSTGSSFSTATVAVVAGGA